MSNITKPGPRAPARRKRLGSVNDASVLNARRQGPKKPKTCCDSPTPGEDEDGKTVCMACGTVLNESNIVAEVTFAEGTNGAAQVQGGSVNANARAANSLGGQANRAFGGGERNAQAQIEANGKKALAGLCPRLNLPDTVVGQALLLYCMAAAPGMMDMPTGKQSETSSFTAGRRTDEVIGACVYAACRRRAENDVLLMDIASIQRINVFRLGEVYKDLCLKLLLEKKGIENTRLVEPEPLILKYCRKLEFGEKTRQVAEDAVKIVQRMKRDWLVTGRHPAGLCGACIILAARMNNFRRSIREVVYVAKVSSVTVAQRVLEFRSTKSAALSVEDFRGMGSRLKYQHDPPSLRVAEKRKQKLEEKQRKRQKRASTDMHIDPNLTSADTSVSPTPSRSEDDLLSGASSPGDQGANREKNQTTQKRKRGAVASADENGSDSTSGDGESSRKRRRSDDLDGLAEALQDVPRVDADGFAIPALPVKKPRGRPKKRDMPEMLQPTPQELIEEAELEKEIEAEVEKCADVIGWRSEDESLQKQAMEAFKSVGAQQQELESKAAKARRDAAGVTWWPNKPAGDGTSATAEELEAEFANDPEVQNCALGEEEVKVKERIWVAHNEDWLRAQHDKDLQAEMKRARGEDKEKKVRGRHSKKKRGKLGDGSSLIESETPIETPADANRAMLDKHAGPGFSRYVNYEALARVYGSPSPSTGPSRPGSEAPSANSSRAGTPRALANILARISASPAPSSPTVGGTKTLPTPPTTQQQQQKPPQVEQEEAPGTEDNAQDEEQVEEGNEYASDLDDTAGNYDDDDDIDAAVDYAGGLAFNEDADDDGDMYGDDDEY
nr:transcription factor iiib 60 kda subunit [Quercus suber]